MHVFRHLWPNFNSEVKDDHVISIALMVNNLDSLNLCEDKQQDKFKILFNRTLSILTNPSIDLKIAASLYGFLEITVGSLQFPVIRRLLTPLVSISIWSSLGQDELNRLLENPNVKRPWKIYEKKQKSMTQDLRNQHVRDRSWIYSVADRFIELLMAETASDEYVTSFVRFVVALISQLPTRRYTNTLFKYMSLLVILRNHNNFKKQKFDNYVKLLEHYIYFPVDDFTGESLNTKQIWQLHCQSLQHLQYIAYSQYKDKLILLALANFDSIHRHVADIEEHLSGLDLEELIQFSDKVNVPVSYILQKAAAGSVDKRKLVLACFAEKYLIKPLPQDVCLNEDYLPTEECLFSDYHTLYTFALQYLNLLDGITRSFYIHRDQYFDNARYQVESIVNRLRPATMVSSKKRQHDGDGDSDLDDDDEGQKVINQVKFNGKSKMAARISKTPQVLRVGLPKIGTNYPSYVTIEATIEVSDRLGWNHLTNQLVYLLTLTSPDPNAKNSAHRLGIKLLTCGRCIQVLDENGNAIAKEDEGDEEQEEEQEEQDGYRAKGRRRTLLINVDSKKYTKDEDIRFNTIIRQRQSNDFNVEILQSILGLIEKASFSDQILPGWLNDYYLGFFADSKSTFENVDFLDTFASIDHIKEHFGKDVVVTEGGPGVKVTVTDEQIIITGDRHVFSGSSSFYQRQVDAIVSSVSNPLTLVTGPPGSGKEEVAAQICKLLYHNFAKERTLIVAKNNTLLSQVFELIDKSPDVNSLHLFNNRANNKLLMDQRTVLLQQVDQLAKSMNVYGAHGDSCETAAYFFSTYVESQWNSYQQQEGGSEVFPFEKFAIICNRDDYDSFYRNVIVKLFRDLEFLRPLELLPTWKAKHEYMITRARIIGLTIDYIIQNRDYLSKLELNVNNVIYLDQCSEVESIIPLTFSPKMKRVCMFGESSSKGLFGRLSQLGPAVGLDHLDSRFELAALTSRYYYELTTTCTNDLANAGFLYTYQFINVDDYQGQGETEPSPGYYQNLGEAEYLVALYQYMRLLGYPKHKITILVAYQSQKLLVQEIMGSRCSNSEDIFGNCDVYTIDQYQGQANDYIIVSFVRTNQYFDNDDALATVIGSAKLGLYMVGRLETFSVKHDYLHNDNSTNLMVVTGELYNKTQRRASDDNAQATALLGVEHLGQYVYEMTQKRLQV